jgi:hypothetical protein
LSILLSNHFVAQEISSEVKRVELIVELIVESFRCVRDFFRN